MWPRKCPWATQLSGRLSHEPAHHGHCSRSLLHPARRGRSAGGAHTTLPAADTALADRRGHGAGGGHFGEQEPRAAITGITTHTDRRGTGTPPTFPAPARTP